MAQRPNNTQRHHHVGLIAGALAVIIHSLWIILVLLGYAQALLDFVYGLHFLNNPFVVSEFNPIKAIGLLGMTFVCGYAIGWVLSYLWDKTKR